MVNGYHEYEEDHYWVLVEEQPTLTKHSCARCNLLKVVHWCGRALKSTVYTTRYYNLWNQITYTHVDPGCTFFDPSPMPDTCMCLNRNEMNRV